ncbi:hypothetical protein ACFLY7_01805 [Patescibacteria group bacterium]
MRNNIMRVVFSGKGKINVNRVGNLLKLACNEDIIVFVIPNIIDLYEEIALGDLVLGEVAVNCIIKTQAKLEKEVMSLAKQNVLAGGKSVILQNCGLMDVKKNYSELFKKRFTDSEVPLIQKRNEPDMIVHILEDGNPSIDGVNWLGHPYIYFDQAGEWCGDRVVKEISNRLGYGFVYDYLSVSNIKTQFFFLKEGKNFKELNSGIKGKLFFSPSLSSIEGGYKINHLVFTELIDSVSPYRIISRPRSGKTISLISRIEMSNQTRMSPEEHNIEIKHYVSGGCFYTLYRFLGKFCILKVVGESLKENLNIPKGLISIKEIGPRSKYRRFVDGLI